MAIDLYKFVNKTVRIKTSGHDVAIGVIRKKPLAPGPYSYLFESQNGNSSLPREITYTPDGYYYSSRGTSEYNISTIEEVSLGQAYPNIDLSKLEGKEVYAVCKDKLSMGSDFTDKLFGRVACHVGNYFICDKSFAKNGAKIASDEHNYIVEIYPEGAFEVKTFGVETPTDPDVEKAKELLKSLSPEQIAAVVESIRNPQNP